VLLQNSAPVVTVSGTTAHALEQGSAITLLAGSPTITDDASTLVGASVKITSGTFSSNEISADDDHLAVNDNGVARVVGTVNGTNISVSYNSTTETLTLNGTDTISNYRAVLGNVIFYSTGDNPTPYDLHNTRTISWTVNDGTFNSAVQATTLTVDALNDAPNVIIGGGNAVLNLNESNSSFNQARQLLSVTETHASDTICEGFGREKVQSRAA
jgi:hypothetical protein